MNIDWAQLGPNFTQLGSSLIQIGSNCDPIESHLPLLGQKVSLAIVVSPTYMAHMHEMLQIASKDYESKKKHGGFYESAAVDS